MSTYTLWRSVYAEQHSDNAADADSGTLAAHYGAHKAAEIGRPCFIEELNGARRKRAQRHGQYRKEKSGQGGWRGGVKAALSTL